MFQLMEEYLPAEPLISYIATRNHDQWRKTSIPEKRKRWIEPWRPLGMVEVYFISLVAWSAVYGLTPGPVLMDILRFAEKRSAQDDKEVDDYAIRVAENYWRWAEAPAANSRSVVRKPAAVRGS